MEKQKEKQIQRYDIQPILKYNADINIIYGERSNGKSWQAKAFLMLKDYLDNGVRFIYLRRFDFEITIFKVMKYFADFYTEISKLTEGRYDRITAYNSEIWLAKYNTDTKKIEKGEVCGYYMNLSSEQAVAGGQFPDVRNIVFEEAMSRTAYLKDEFDKLNNLFCTIDRKRNYVKLWFIGNSISKNNPYFIGYDILPEVRRLKQGSIITKEIILDDDGAKRTLAIEHTAQSGVSSYTVGAHSEMLNSGDWQEDIQPVISDNFKNYRKLFTCGFEYKTFRYLAYLLRDKNYYKWFIFPKKGNFKKNTILFTDTIDDNIFNNPNPYNLKVPNKQLAEIMETFKESNIFYCNYLTGTEFKDVINFTIRR